MLNIDYVFCGYNIYYGNPKTMQAMVDPGLRQAIFQVSYDLNEVTGDNRYQKPDGIEIGSCGGTCLIDFETSTIHGEKSYQNSLDLKVLY